MSPSPLISLPSMRWGRTGSLDMLEYEVMRPPTSSQGAALLWGFLDLSQPWQSLDRIQKRRISRWLVNQHWYNGEVLAIPKDRFEN